MFSYTDAWREAVPAFAVAGLLDLEGLVQRGSAGSTNPNNASAHAAQRKHFGNFCVTRGLGELNLYTFPPPGRSYVILA